MKKLLCVLLAMMTVFGCLTAVSAETIKEHQEVLFGKYPVSMKTGTSPDPKFEKEDIVWIVLKVDGEAALLLSKECLYARKWNPTVSNVRVKNNLWKSSEIREWLNTDFLEKAFTEEEQAALLTTSLTDVETRDKVFLLSAEEVSLYLAENRFRKASCTDYAKYKGVKLSSEIEINGKPTGRWWLRSCGSSNQSAYAVNNSGAVCSYRVQSKDVGIRPAIWVTISALRTR